MLFEVLPGSQSITFEEHELPLLRVFLNTRHLTGPVIETIMQHNPVDMDHELRKIFVNKLKEIRDTEKKNVVF